VADGAGEGEEEPSDDRVVAFPHHHQRIVLTTLALRRFLDRLVDTKATTVAKLLRRRLTRGAYDPLLTPTSRRWGRYNYLLLNNRWIR